jgi:CRP-like cAMP-binding protein
MVAESNYLTALTDTMDFAADIPKEELCRLLKRKRTITLAKNEYFLMAGDVPKYIGFVRSGLLRLFYIDVDGVEANKHFCLENTLAISYSAFLQREESRFYIQALEDTELLAIDHRTYRDLLDSHICWQIVARKLAEMLFILKEKSEFEFLLVEHAHQQRRGPVSIRFLGQRRRSGKDRRRDRRESLRLDETGTPVVTSAGATARSRGRERFLSAGVHPKEERPGLLRH